MVLMRIFIAAHCSPILVVAVAFFHGGVDISLRVACGAAGFCALAQGKRTGEDWHGKGQSNECLWLING